MATTPAHPQIGRQGWPMATRSLRDYIASKRQAMQAAATARPDPKSWRETVEATVVADDATGVRKLHIGSQQYISDSGPAFGGFRLGPSSPELLCGVIGTCLTHTYEIAAATLDVPLDYIEVRVSADNNDAGLLGIDCDDPPLPWNIRAHVKVQADGVSSAALARVHAFVAERCPLTRLIRTENSLQIIID